MNLKLVTLAGIQIDEDIYEIIIPTSTGEIAVYPGHECLVTNVVPGAIMIRHKKEDDDSKLSHFAVSGGIAEISQKSVKILVDEATSGDDISEEEARAALERAKTLHENATNQIELDEAYQLVDKHSVRLRVAELQRHRRNRLS